jgi:hypothetical protein
MNLRSIIFITTLLSFTSLSVESNAYQEMEVTNGGSIQGKATMIGEMPYPRVYHLILFPNIDMCAEVDTDDEMNRVLDDFKISEDGGLKDVVITLEHVEAGKPFNKKPILIASEDCKFTPDVNAVRQGEAFQVNNLDAVMHNSQVYQAERGKIIQNLPVPPEGVTNGKIDNIPPGDYNLHAWHYLMKPQNQRIHVAKNGTIDVNFEFDAGKVVRPLYETIKSGRIKKDAVYPGSAKGRELGK